VGLDVEYRTLVKRFFVPRPELRFAFRVVLPIEELEEANMGRGLLLWLLGVPIPVIILLWLFFGR
jgi:hypothetical protein